MKKLAVMYLRLSRDDGEEIESNAIQVHIHHLRKKLGKHLIRTIHAVGYVIDKPGTTAPEELKV